ncbi:MAG: archease [Candidatus Thermoplasmatota archaeon]|nr:archease [Candidatus Thermoplasmatota archaeon]MBU4071382.1 archease [Candidatus Thermoplasmatota archaeon]MBU4143486.1 archease [Candidatus Thermoplasmatota archaeon]MBU4591720.1 archease [Candidatus Thermoplasmatota archaeon]
MPERYEIIDHTADIAIRTSGSNLNQAFENAAYALFDTMCDASTVRPLKVKKVEIESEDMEQLLVDWLSRLLFICDVDDMLYSEFEVTITGTTLKATMKGEKLDADRHQLKTDIKAITYHMLEVNTDTNTVQVLFDI